MDEREELNIEAIKHVFFDPQYGGSRELEQVITTLMGAHKKMYKFINRHVTGTEQRQLEQESRREFSEEWVSATKNLRSSIMLLLHVQPHDDPAKFMHAIEALDLHVPEIEASGVSQEVKCQDYLALFANHLADYYEGSARISRSYGRLS